MQFSEVGRMTPREKVLMQIALDSIDIINHVALLMQPIHKTIALDAAKAGNMIANRLRNALE